MSFFSALYLIVIRPLELLFEVIYVVANRMIHNPGISIIALSLAMNFLVLPLYRRADAMQEEQRNTEKKLEKWTSHIRRTFSGDKRFMIQQEYYRQNNYKPTYALRGSLSLLLEIPFFIAAYRFLSGLQLLQGVSFGPIQDLGSPDGLLKVGMLSINVLPILMTLINIVSGAIYTKGMPIKTKLQLYGMALVFLVFLYRSPAGLVFYWTLNNLFSLIKNVFYKLKNPKRVLCILASIFGIILVVYFAFFYDHFSIRRRLVFVTLGFILQLPLIFDRLSEKGHLHRKTYLLENHSLFVFSALICSILIGLLIPSAVIASSPSEFIDLSHVSSPLSYLFYSGLLSFGCFFLWASLFYFLMDETGKVIFQRIYFSIACIFLFNYMVYGKGQSNLSAELQYEVAPVFSANQQLINLLFVLVLFLVVYFTSSKLKRVSGFLAVTVSLTVAAMCLVNISTTSKKLNSSLSYITQQADAAKSIKEDGLIKLSRDGNNVVVIMLDRAMGCYVPYIFQEKPELIEKFDGFTYYHNAISYGAITVYGAPAMLGGYEYTPAEINAHSEKTFLEKYNEATLLMPVIFDANDYQVTVCNAPIAGLQYIPDLSVFDDYPDIDTVLLYKKISVVDTDLNSSKEEIRQRNFFCFGITKVAPLFFQDSLYDYGVYNEATDAENAERVNVQVRTSLSEAYGIDSTFINAYSIIDNLSELTKIENSNTNTYFYMSNDMTHDVNLLQEPDYLPSFIVDNTTYDYNLNERYIIDGLHMTFKTPGKVAHYQCNVAAMQLLAKWFDYLRDQGVYDNTRIILVSDHASTQNQFEELMIDDIFDAQGVMTLLMVKDFNASGFTTSDELMTNADTPLLAMKGLIKDPVNPFTGNQLTTGDKDDGELVILYGKVEMQEFRNDNVFPEGEWYSVHDDVYQKENWLHVDAPD